jgi:uncharacterized protein (TIGR00255 family)
MLNSMTGFGSETLILRETSYVIEIKTLNSKGIDFFFKSPSIFRNLEIQFKSILQKSLERGKIELNISTKDGKKGFFSIDETLFVQQYDFLADLAQKVNSTKDVFPLVVQNYSNLQDVEDLTEEELKAIFLTIEMICTKVNQYRTEEGKVVESDINTWLNQIETNKNTIANIEPARVSNRKEKLLQGIKDIAVANEIDYNRLGQEMIYYIEKLDISEELSRLSQHINLFRNSVASSENAGKKLGFVTQEIGREINTIGSKANDSEIQHLVVDMKDQLEKIKEQLNNII